MPVPGAAVSNEVAPGAVNQPYAASTPSRPVAHRSGPPRDAFDPTPSAAANTAPYGNPSAYSGMSAPVGSGVADGEVASYRRPSPGQPYPYAEPYATPANPSPYPPAPYQQPTGAYQTPYQSQPAGPAYGQPGPQGNGAVDQIATRPPHVGARGAGESASRRLCRFQFRQPWQRRRLAGFKVAWSVPA